MSGAAPQDAGGGAGSSHDAGPPPSEEPEPPRRKTAYDPDGPVEAVGLQADPQFWTMFHEVRTLGKGHFAKVKQICHAETAEHFAVKILDKTLADHDIEDLVREFQMLRTLRHPNIIRLYGAYETPRKLYLVTELASGGELMKRLGDTSKTYSEDLIRDYVLLLVKAVGYMHRKNCVHRDLKPENVLLSDPTDDAEIKIVDLGLSRFFEDRKLMRTICGTHKYLAPELVQCDRGQIQGYDKAIDMWGIGLLTFIMLFGFNPFARGCQQDTHNAILKCEWSFPEGFTVSELACDFISCLLLQRASARLSATEALAHHWLAADKPASPGALLSNERKPVKALLSEFNAQRMLNKIVKGAHRRLSSDPREKQ